jgi:putative Flp pilus-assembly TadE/G-like protein
MYAPDSQRGQVMPLVAFCLVVLMLFAGLAVDAGYWSYQQRQQQNAADAAALGGAQALLANGCNNQTAANTAGQFDAASNGYTNGSGGVTVTVKNPAVVGPYAGQSCAVSAVVTNTKVNRFFSTILGGGNTIPVTTQAVATLVSNANGCIYLESPSQTFQLNGVNIQAPNCGILANSSTVQTNGGTVNVAGFGYAQSLQNNSTNYTKASPSRIPPFVDPCPEISGCSYLAANPQPQTNCQSVMLNGGSQTIGGNSNGNCFSQIQVNGGTLTMLPGQYTITGLFQQNGGSIIGAGVSMYVTASGGPIQINGGNTTFSAPTTGSNAGVLIYQSPGNSQLLQLNGGNNSLAGLIYAPSAFGQVNGTGGQYAVLVFADMQFNGTNTAVYGGPTTGNSLIKNAVLAQ